MQDAEKAAQEQEDREERIALGNPLLNPKAFNVKRRWDDDVVFKNQARGTEQKGNKEFVNVNVRKCSPGARRLTLSGPSSIGLPQEIHGRIISIYSNFYIRLTSAVQIRAMMISTRWESLHGSGSKGYAKASEKLKLERASKSF